MTPVDQYEGAIPSDVVEPGRPRAPAAEHLHLQIAVAKEGFADLSTQLLGLPGMRREFQVSAATDQQPCQFAIQSEGRPPLELQRVGSLRLSR